MIFKSLSRRLRNGIGTFSKHAASTVLNLETQACVAIVANIILLNLIYVTESSLLSDEESSLLSEVLA